MVNRGPQFVQLTKGYRNRRSAGSRSSRRQSSQVAESAEISVSAAPPPGLATISNPASPVAGISRTCTSSTTASGGAWAFSAVDEGLDPRLPFGLDEDAVHVVPDEPGQPEPQRKLVDEGPEPDALHNPGDPDRHPHALSLRPAGPFGQGGQIRVLPQRVEHHVNRRAQRRAAPHRGRDRARHRCRQLAARHAVAAVHREARQQRDRQPGLDVLQRHQVVAEPAHHPRLETGLAAQAQGQVRHVRLRDVDRPRLVRERREIHRPRPAAGCSGGSHQHDRVRRQRDDVEVGPERQLDEVGGRDDHVRVAATQRGHALVRLQLQQLDVQVRIRARQPGHGRDRHACGSRSGTRPAVPGRRAPRRARAAPPRPCPCGRGSPARAAPGSGPAGVSRTRRPVRSSSWVCVSASSTASCCDTLDALRLAACATARTVPRVSSWLSSRSRHGFNIIPILVRFR